MSLFSQFINKVKNLRLLLMASNDITSILKNELLEKEKKVYNLRLNSNLNMSLRSRTTDIHEVTAVLSGRDYPESIFRKLFPEQINTVLDVGAHIGTFFLYLAKHNLITTSSKYYAFEPHPESFQILKKNSKSVTIPGFRAFQSAVSNHNGKVRFTFASNPNESHISDDEGELVSVTDINSIIEEQKINRLDVLKLDCEGEELLILKSFKYWSRTSLIVAEYHTHIDSDRLTNLRAIASKHTFSEIYHTPTPELASGIVVFAPMR